MKKTLFQSLIFLWIVAFPCPSRAQDSPYARGVKHARGGDYKLGAAAFAEGVAAGDAGCMDYLGYLYLEGLGQRPSPWIAFGLFREAAELGNDQACRNLGDMYFSGRAVDPDSALAAFWWKKSTECGADPRPAFSLGQLYFLGEGVEPNSDLARKYWNLAKKLNSGDAIVALTVLEARAGRVDTDGLHALAKNGHITAQGTLQFFKLSEAGVKTLVKDVPFVHQAHNFCALASSTMLLRYQGVKTSQFDVARKRSRHKWGEGSHWDEMVAVAGKFGQKWQIDSFAYSEDGFKAGKKAIIAQLRAGSPVIIDILANETSPSAHSILICGYDPKAAEFLARNSALPFPGFQTLTEERLQTIWRSRGFLPNNSKLLRPTMSMVRKD